MVGGNNSLPTFSSFIAMNHEVQGFQSESVFLWVTRDAFSTELQKNAAGHELCLTPLEFQQHFIFKDLVS